MILPGPKPSVESRNERRAFIPIGFGDMTGDTVGCPRCFVRYADEPLRCDACGYRFDRPEADTDD